MERHKCEASNARLFLSWIKERGGVAIWGCLDLSNAGMSWSAPVTSGDGTSPGKPHWSATNEPVRVITDPAEIDVDTPKEVRRIRVAVRHGSGMRLDLTPASTRKVHAAVDKAGDGAWYAFDYWTQEAVIYVPDKTVTLDEWERQNAAEVTHA